MIKTYMKTNVYSIIYKLNVAVVSIPPNFTFINFTEETFIYVFIYLFLFMCCPYFTNLVKEVANTKNVWVLLRATVRFMSNRYILYIRWFY